MNDDLGVNDMKEYKATATVSWNFEIPPGLSPNQFARKQFEEMIGDTLVDYTCYIKIDKLKQKKHREVLGEFTPDEVLPYISNSEEKKIYTVGDKKYKVRMSSQRYFVFRENLRCVSCGIEGVIFRLEQHPNDKSPHFNLYALEDGKPVMLTKDHIHAKANGGEDCHSNYQTMCSICNNLKGSDQLTLEAIAELRAVYNANRKIVPKRQLNSLLEEARKKCLSENNVTGEEKELGIFAKVDIHVMLDNDGQMVGVSVYDAPATGMRHIACVKKGTKLETVRIGDRTLDVKIYDDIFLIVKHMVDINGD